VTGSEIDHELDVTDVIRMKPGLPTSALAPITWAASDPDARLDQKMFGSLPRFVADNLSAHLRAMGANTTTDLIFPATERGSLRRTNWTRPALEPALERAGLEMDPGSHSPRHSQVALLIAGPRHGRPNVETTKAAQ
jgi:hypothetical protein